MFILSSSLSVWVKNCDALELPEEPRQQLEEFIDGLYQKIEEAGKLEKITSAQILLYKLL